jgi:hypothetical protein
MPSGYDNINDWYENSRRKKKQIGTKIEDKAFMKCNCIQFKDGEHEHKSKNAQIILFRLKDKDYAGQDEVKIWIKLEKSWEQIEKQVVKNLKEVSIYINTSDFKNGVGIV